MVFFLSVTRKHKDIEKQKPHYVQRQRELQEEIGRLIFSGQQNLPHQRCLTGTWGIWDWGKYSASKVTIRTATGPRWIIRYRTISTHLHWDVGKGAEGSTRVGPPCARHCATYFTPIWSPIWSPALH